MTSDNEGDDDFGQPTGETQPAVPLVGEITQVTGRRAERGQRGLPAFDYLSLRQSDGSTADFGPPDRGNQDTLTFLASIPARTFCLSHDEPEPICPICLAEVATDREHVPQRNLGGRVMTMTCKRCNNGLGSKVEAPLQDWFDHALTSVAFEHEGEVRGRRRVPKMYLRQSEDEKFVLIIDGDLTPEAEQMLRGGKFNMNYQEPHPRAYWLALLKHSYLAACLYLGHVPDTDEVHAIRADLMAARDTPRKQPPPESEAAKLLSVYRSHVGTQGPPLALVARHQPSGAEPEFLLSLAGVLFVSWPFAHSPPGSWRRADPDAQTGAQ